LRFHQIDLYVHALVLTEAAATQMVRRVRKRLTMRPSGSLHRKKTAFLAFCTGMSYKFLLTCICEVEKHSAEKPSGGARRVAERGEQQDKNQREQDERRGDEPSEDESRERENEGLRARLDKLSNALDAQQRDARMSSRASGLGQEGAGPSPGSMGNAMGLAFRVLSEFVAAVIVGAFIGWWIDRLAGTTPAFLVTFLLMGAAAGFWNVYRIAIKPPGSEGR
jgi:ATP synthase protein I